MKQRKPIAFTLIEMLIVIVIIGILAAALVPRLQSVQARARDTKRKTDLRQIYSANEIYVLDNGKYAKPDPGAYNVNTWANSTTAGFWIPALSGIMTSIPVDPVNNTAGPWVTGNLAYAYGDVFTTDTVGKNTYDLVAQLENSSDADRCAVKQYKRNYSAPITLQNRCGTFSSMIYDLSPDNGVN